MEKWLGFQSFNRGSCIMVVYRQMLVMFLLGTHVHTRDFCPCHRGRHVSKSDFILILGQKK